MAITISENVRELKENMMLWEWWDEKVCCKVKNERMFKDLQTTQLDKDEGVYPARGRHLDGEQSEQVERNRGFVFSSSLLQKPVICEPAFDIHSP